MEEGANHVRGIGWWSQRQAEAAADAPAPWALTVGEALPREGAAGGPLEKRKAI